MSVYDFYQNRMKINSNSTGNSHLTVGEKLKSDSDMLMEATWYNDPQSKICYIYDYFHDDNSTIAEQMSYENTRKTKIDAKFIITKYSSIDKDQIEYHIQFKPSQKVYFSESDDLYYFETDYRQRYKCDPFIGKYIDIPDDTGVYKKWMIVQKEIANQFVKYSVLPCDYYLQWVENTERERIKRSMWCISRAMNSYTSGRWRDRYFLQPDDIQKVWLPLNSITEHLTYVSNIKKNQRIALSALVPTPLVWQVSKVENTKPLGIVKITLDQDAWNEKTDYVNIETGEMFADLFDSNIKPVNPELLSLRPIRPLHGEIVASTYTVKVGGGYKTLSAKIYNSDKEEITNEYSDATFIWTCNVVNGDQIIDLTNMVTWLDGSSPNQKKIKFPEDRNYLGKILNVLCVIKKESDTIECNIPFELVSI